MAQFYATIKGTRGEASRLGSKTTGLVANINGWDSGIRVEAYHASGGDCFAVYATAGSNARHSSLRLGTLVVSELGTIWQTAPNGETDTVVFPREDT